MPQFTREERFWFNVSRDEEDPQACWQWLGAHGRGGYARLGRTYAHRFSYELHVGPVPDGLEVDHLCGNRACTNYHHLEPATHAENMRRNAIATKTHCKRGHPLSGDNLHVKRGGGRFCRACGLMRDKAYREKLGEAYREKQRARYAASHTSR